MRLTIKLDTSELKKMDKIVKANAPKAMKSALTRALKSGVATFEGSKEGAPSVYNIKKAELEEATKIRGTAIVVKSRLYTIGQSPSHFKMTPGKYTSQKGILLKPATKKDKRKKKASSKKRKIATASIKKNQQKTLKHAFIANPAAFNHGHVMLWERTGKGRMIAPIRSVSAAQMLSNEEIQDNVMNAITEMYEKRLDHEIKRLKI